MDELTPERADAKADLERSLARFAVAYDIASPGAAVTATIEGIDEAGTRTTSRVRWPFRRSDWTAV